MADANKPVRLSKAAREFNLGIGTIVDFLETKGIKVDAKPNTKLDPDVYALVRGNFQGDKEAKEAAQRSTVSVDRENISLASAKKRVATPEEEEEPEIDLSIFKKSEAQQASPRSVEAKQEPVEEVPVVEVEATEPEQAPEPTHEPEVVVEKAESDVKDEAKDEVMAEEQVVSEPVEEKKAEEKPVEKLPKSPLKVLGKVDFKAQEKEAAANRKSATP